MPSTIFGAVFQNWSCIAERFTTFIQLLLFFCSNKHWITILQLTFSQSFVISDLLQFSLPSKPQFPSLFFLWLYGGTFTSLTSLTPISFYPAWGGEGSKWHRHSTSECVRDLWGRSHLLYSQLLTWAIHFKAILATLNSPFGLLGTVCSAVVRMFFLLPSTCTNNEHSDPSPPIYR